MKFYLKIKTLLPLFMTVLIIIVLTTTKAYYTSLWMTPSMIIDFMGWWLLIFGAFKLIDLPGFVKTYGTYNIIAKQFKLYGFTYPFIEISLGLVLLSRLEVIIACWITLILMLINSIGIYRSIHNKKALRCACLGTVFQLPMSYVSLGENLLIGTMALVIILGL